MQIKFYNLSKPELEFLKENCNFTKDESILLNMASVRCSDIQIAEKLNIAVSTVTKRKRKLLEKIKLFVEGTDGMVTVYINGKPVTKDEMKDYTLCVEKIGETISAKLTKKEK